MEIKSKKFRIIVKANASKSQIKCYNEQKQAYELDIKAKAEDNKANIEIIRFLTKQLKKKVRISSGLKSKEKIIEVLD